MMKDSEKAIVGVAALALLGGYIYTRSKTTAAASTGSATGQTVPNTSNENDAMQGAVAADIASSGIPADQLAQMQKLAVPVVTTGPLGNQSGPAPGSIQNDAFLAGVPGAIGTVQVGTVPVDKATNTGGGGIYDQYQIPNYPAAGTILGGATIPAGENPTGQDEFVEYVADGSGGQNSVFVSASDYATAGL